MCDNYIPTLERRSPLPVPARWQDGWTSESLAREQERKADDARSLSYDMSPTSYRLYTEDFDNLPTIIARYFAGASIYHVTGVWQGSVEKGAVIEILAAFQYRDKVVRLAADIADTNAQSEVIVTWQSSHGFEQVRVFGTKDTL